MPKTPQQLNTSPQVEEANLFTITGPMTISYSRSSIAGVPQFSYRDGELNLSFSGEGVTQQDTSLNELVTITLEHVADVFVRTLTVLVPKIRVRVGEEVSFQTLAIETIDRSGAFIAPPGPMGVLQTYRSHQLEGSATAVIS